MEPIRLSRRSFAGLGLGLGAFALAGAPAFAAAEELGPPIGAKALDIGTPQDQTGKKRTLDSLMGDKGVVACNTKARRLVVPRYWLRATTSWPG